MKRKMKKMGIPLFVVLSMLIGFSGTVSAAAALNESYHFNDYTTQNDWLNKYGTSRQDNMPEGWTLLTGDQGWNPAAPELNAQDGASNGFHAKAVDQKHGVSLASFFNTANAGHQFASPIAADKPLYVSFEFNTEYLATTNFYLNGITNALLNINLTEGKFYLSVAQDKDSLDYAIDTWNKVDMIISPCDAEQNRTFTAFLNGEKLAYQLKLNVDQITSFCMSSKGYANYGDPKWIYFDNFCFTDDISGTTLNVTTQNISGTAAELNAENGVEIAFDRTLDLSIFNSQMSNIQMVKKDIETNIESVVDCELKVHSSATAVSIKPLEGFLTGCEYKVTFPDTLKGSLGESMNEAEVVTITTREIFDVYDDFDAYQTGDNIPLPKPSNETDHGYCKNNNWWDAATVNIAADQSLGNYIASIPAASNLYYLFPYAIDSGKLAVSFDFLSRDMIDDSAFEVTLFGDGTNTKANMFFGRITTEGGNHKLKYSWNGNEKNINKDVWNHIDIVADCGASTVAVYLNGEKLNEMVQEVQPYTSCKFGVSKSSPAIDNLHIRQLEKNSISTNIGSTVPSSIKIIEIHFRDPVKKELLTEENIRIAAVLTGDTVDYSIAECTENGVKLTLTNELTLDVKYSVVMDKSIVGYLGEELDRYSFDFTVKNSILSITGAAITEGEAELTSAAKWDPEKTYRLRYAADNGSKEAMKAVFFVAGYNDNGCLAAVQPVEVTIPVGGGADLETELAPMSMNGAVVIKIFGLRDFGILSPIMSEPCVIE